MNQMLEELIAHEWEIPMTLIVKAKELVQVEKEQICDALDFGKVCLLQSNYKSAEQYYNETYGKSNGS